MDLSNPDFADPEFRMRDYVDARFKENLEAVLAEQDRAAECLILYGDGVPHEHDGLPHLVARREKSITRITID